MEAQVDRRVRTYGNWRRPRSAGLGQLGSLGTLILLAGMIAVILTSAIFGALPAVMMLIVFGDSGDMFTATSTIDIRIRSILHHEFHQQ